MNTLACTFALACTLAAGAASAETVRVTYGDLDLSSSAGARAFASRINVAARNACPGPERGDLRSYVEHPSCVAQMREALINALPAAKQTAYAAAKRAGASTYVRAAGALAERGASTGG